MNVFVFDIETVPDVEAGRRLYDLDGLSDQDVASAMFALRRAKVGHDFLPHHLHKIVAISLVFHQGKQFNVWSLGEPSANEADLIQRFFSGLDKHTPTLVSWNGSGFDLPVLHYRALHHGISAPIYWEQGEQQSSFRWNNYLSRFHQRHLDLMDILSGYQNKAVAPLDEIAVMLGFPGKMGMRGDKVWEAYQAGDIRNIRDYCETDVLNTYCIYLRFELMRGLLQHSEYESHLEQLRQYLARDPSKTHFIEFLNQMPSTKEQ